MILSLVVVSVVCITSGGGVEMKVEGVNDPFATVNSFVFCLLQS